MEAIIDTMTSIWNDGLMWQILLIIFIFAAISIVAWILYLPVMWLYDIILYRTVTSSLSYVDGVVSDKERETSYYTTSTYTNGVITQHHHRSEYFWTHLLCHKLNLINEETISIDDEDLYDSVTTNEQVILGYKEVYKINRLDGVKHFHGYKIITVTNSNGKIIKV